MAVIDRPATAPVELIRTVLPLPLKVDAVVLAGAAKTVTIPAGVSFASFKAIGDVAHVNRNGTAAAAAADTQNGSDDGSASWPIEGDGPQLYNVRGETSLSVFGTAAVVYIAWYRDQSDVG